MRVSNKAFALAVILCLTAAGSRPWAQSEIQVTARQATIRLDPSTAAAALATVPAGTVLRKLEQSDDWFKVLLPVDASGFQRAGYVHKSLIREFAASTSIAPSSPAVSRASGESASLPAAAPDAVRAADKDRSTERAAPVTLSGVPAAVLSDDGLYYAAGSSLTRIEAKTPYQTRTGSTMVSRLTLGIKAARLNAMLPGLRADTAVGTSPVFWLHLGGTESVGEYYLIRFTVKERDGRREIEVGSANFLKLQAGFAEKDLFLTDAKRIQKDIYEVSPKSALSPGEYGLLQIPQVTGAGQTGLTPRKIFDFSVR